MTPAFAAEAANPASIVNIHRRTLMIIALAFSHRRPSTGINEIRKHRSYGCIEIGPVIMARCLAASGSLIPNPRRSDSEGLPAAIRNDSS
jgi:hypothetical protein